MTDQSTTSILTEVEAFLATTGMGESYFGRKAVGNTEVVKRLRMGCDITTTTVSGLRRFMEANAPSNERGAGQ